MTEKQIILRDYLLKRLGFEDSDFKNEYIDYLDKIAVIHRSIAAIPNNDPSVFPPKRFYYYDHENERYLPENFTIVDLLIWEYKLKKDRLFKIIDKKSDLISATDLANYTYCPIGYSIGKTFETPKNHLSEIGTKKHEDHRLINSKQLQSKENTSFDTDSLDSEMYSSIDKQKFNSFINSETESFFNDVNSSELVFLGHSEKANVQNYFINKEKGFIGQPDYIFKNEKGENYIVEEKFKRINESNQNNFFNNHKVQLASYIYYLDQFKIDYGYLIYWLYDFYGSSQMHVQSCKVIRIDRTNAADLFLTKTYNSVIKFNQQKYLDIDIKELNAKKCASCVYVLICGHKNQKRNQVSLPYDFSYFNLFRAEYPEELKKNVIDLNSSKSF